MSVEKTLSVTFPKILEARDYHDFYTVEEVLNQVFEEKIKVEEIGFNYETGQYEGIAFSGRSAERIKNKRRKELELIEQMSDLEIDFSPFRDGSSTTEALFEFVAVQSMDYHALLDQCSYNKECRRVINSMKEEVALGTAKKMAKAFLFQEGYGQEDIDAFA